MPTLEGITYSTFWSSQAKFWVFQPWQLTANETLLVDFVAAQLESVWLRVCSSVCACVCVCVGGWVRVRVGAQVPVFKCESSTYMTSALKFIFIGKLHRCRSYGTYRAEWPVRPLVAAPITGQNNDVFEKCRPIVTFAFLIFRAPPLKWNL